MKDVYISFWISYETNLWFEDFCCLSNMLASAKVGIFSVGGKLSPSSWNIWVFQIVRFNFGSFSSVKVSSVECWCKNIRKCEQRASKCPPTSLFLSFDKVLSVVSQLAVGFGPQLEWARSRSKLRVPTKVIVLRSRQAFWEICDHSILRRHRKCSTFWGRNVCFRWISDKTYKKSVN